MKKQKCKYCDKYIEDINYIKRVTNSYENKLINQSTEVVQLAASIRNFINMIPVSPMQIEMKNIAKDMINKSNKLISIIEKEKIGEK